MAVPKDIEKYWVGARMEGEKPKIPRSKHIRRKDGRPSDLPVTHNLGEQRLDFKKQDMFVKHQVNYKLATPQQITKGETCETCLYWKDGAACHLVLGYIEPDAWCNKWEQSEVLQKALPPQAPTAVEALKEKTKKGTVKHPSVHSHRDDHPTHLHVQIHKEGNGGGEGGFGGGEGAATVFTSTNAGIFNPTHGERDTKKKKKKSDKKTGIERLAHFLTDNSPEKKMMKSGTEILTEVLNSVRLELQKEDIKRQTPYKSAPIETDPPQVIEEEGDAESTAGSQLVIDQDNTEKEQKRIMDETKLQKMGRTSGTAQWGSGSSEVSEYHRGGKKDNIEPDDDDDRTEKDSQEIILNRRKRTAQLVKEEGYTWGEALFKAVDEEIDDYSK